MRLPQSYRLSFLVPPVLAFSVPLGRHQPCQAGCLIEVEAADHHRALMVAIDGPTRDAVFDQARRFLRIHAKGHGALSIAAVLRTPAPPSILNARGQSDGWSIIIGADIAFSPTSLPPELGPPDRDDDPIAAALANAAS